MKCCLKTENDYLKTQTKHPHFRLCLVAVKRFPENTYFPKMLISGKGKYFHVFGCILKNFPKNIFWCLVFGKEEGKHKSENKSHNPENT